MLLPTFVPPVTGARATPPEHRGVLVIIDLNGCPTVRAARSRMAQRVTEVQCELFTSPHLDRAAILVTTGERSDARHIRAHAHSLAAAMLRRVELRRGRACGVLVVVDDHGAPDEAVPGLIRAALDHIPEGCDLVDAADVVALGLRPAVFNARA